MFLIYRLTVPQGRKSGTIKICWVPDARANNSVLAAADQSVAAEYRSGFRGTPSDAVVFGRLILWIFGVPLSIVRIAGGIILVRVGFELFLGSPF